jgi:hypothetical protein
MGIQSQKSRTTFSVKFAKTGPILHVSMMDEQALAQKRVVLSVIVVTWCRFKLT